VQVGDAEEEKIISQSVTAKDDVFEFCNFPEAEKNRFIVV
jgi:hypothetical protein